MLNPSPPDAFVERLRSVGRALVTSHASPDGDAIGSQLGLARLLRATGKSATVWDAEPVPSIYTGLPGADRVRSGAEPPAGFPDAFDALIVVECPTLERTGLEATLAGKLPILNFDHHLGNQVYGDVNWVDTAAPAAGEMVLQLSAALHVTLDADTATCLLMALVSDTGSFRFSNATRRAFEAAATLVDAGASPEAVSQRLYESRPEASLRLQGEMLSTLALHAGGRVATATLTQEMYARSAADSSDAEGLIDQPRSIAGVDAVALLREIAGESVKVSLRSRGSSADVERIAKRHGGGGHRNAAGCRLSGELEPVRQQIANELEEELKR
ncbi:MAG: bifunctional oligoribonuclease/PAP phosphatase NrnA [Acidobacteriota bacterium]|nr:bifunctional oligoribonuclease/PAP phosphatase NrnA [Acidobacteriota bacterium]